MTFTKYALTINDMLAMAAFIIVPLALSAAMLYVVTCPR